MLKVSKSFLTESHILIKLCLDLFYIYSHKLQMIGD